MRTAFEAWAQQDGHIVRRREDKPEEYLVSETQRRWVIWQAALAHGKPTGAGKVLTAKSAVGKSDEAAARDRVLDEVLNALSALGGTAAMEEILKVIEGLKTKQKGFAVDKVEGSDNAV